MPKDADTEASELIGLAIAAAVEAGWSRDAFDNLVNSTWTDIQKMFARHLVGKVLAEAMVKRPKED